MLDYACQAAAPAGRLLPKRGFGLVWCKDTGVKEGLGWATAEEAGSTAEWQVFQGGEMWLLSGQSALYALYADGSFVTHSIQ